MNEKTQNTVNRVSGHIREPYTLDEIAAKIDSHDYSAEMILQHLLRIAASATKEGRK